MLVQRFACGMDEVVGRLGGWVLGGKFSMQEVIAFLHERQKVLLLTN